MWEGVCVWRGVVRGCVWWEVCVCVERSMVEGVCVCGGRCG